MNEITAARFPHGEVPNVTNLDPAAAETFRKGRILTRVGDTVQRHAGGAVVTNIFGVAQSGATAGEGDQMDRRVNVAKNDGVTEFSARLYDAVGAAFVTPDPAVHIGEQYGFVTVDGVDYLDTSDQVNVVAEVTDVKVDLDIVLFKFLPGTRQEVW